MPHSYHPPPCLALIYYRALHKLHCQMPFFIPLPCKKHPVRTCTCKSNKTADEQSLTLASFVATRGGTWHEPRTRYLRVSVSLALMLLTSSFGLLHDLGLQLLGTLHLELPCKRLLFSAWPPLSGPLPCTAFSHLIIAHKCVKSLRQLVSFSLPRATAVGQVFPLSN